MWTRKEQSMNNIPLSNSNRTKSDWELRNEYNNAFSARSNARRNGTDSVEHDIRILAIKNEMALRGLLKPKTVGTVVEVSSLNDEELMKEYKNACSNMSQACDRGAANQDHVNRVVRANDEMDNREILTYLALNQTEMLKKMNKLQWEVFKNYQAAKSANKKLKALKELLLPGTSQALISSSN